MAATCVIAGGGPAGMMCGLVLARAGVDVTVLEKHSDFLRDFRGDTVHASTLELIDELGLTSEFDAIGASHISSVQLPDAHGRSVTIVDMARLRKPHPYIAMTPQWDLLSMLAKAGEREPHFSLIMDAEVTGVLRAGDRINGVEYRNPRTGETNSIEADLTIAADGRGSAVRAAAGLPVINTPVPFDIWWFRLPTVGMTVDAKLLPRGRDGAFFIFIPRTGYVQTAQLIPKGSDAQMGARGIEALRAEIAAAQPEFAQPAQSVELDDVKLLDVRVDHAPRWWKRGLLCIGDAVHAMSPLGGVGVNLAIQDGVAAAALLAAPLLDHTISDADVAAVQRRREFASRAVQRVQQLGHVAVSRIMRAGGAPYVPDAAAFVLQHAPQLTALPAHVVGIGLRPEHIPDFARR